MTDDIVQHPNRAVQLCHEALVWIIPQIDKLPRHRRFTVGERIESGLLRVLEDLIEASYSRRNKATLARANRKLAAVRHIWRVCFELENISLRRYEFGAQLLVQIGQQIGGWQQHTRS